MNSLDAFKIIYVCHSFAENPFVNTEMIRRLCRLIATEGFVPLAPQLFLPTFLDEQTERALAMSFCLRLIAVSDELWVYGDTSGGMRLEIAEARRLGIPVVKGKIE